MLPSIRLFNLQRKSKKELTTKTLLLSRQYTITKKVIGFFDI